MAYFTREEYDRKREYAARIAASSISALADATGIDEYDLEVVAEASSLRHKLHSEDRWHFVSSEARGTTDLDTIGTQYSYKQTVADEVDALKLLDEPFPIIVEPDVDDDDSPEDILDYFGQPVPDGDEDDALSAAREALYCGWDEAINGWSSAVRRWFKSLNEKYGTEFPC